jgi:hypothetical protein
VVPQHDVEGHRGGTEARQGVDDVPRYRCIQALASIPFHGLSQKPEQLVTQVQERLAELDPADFAVSPSIIQHVRLDAERGRGLG